MKFKPGVEINCLKPEMIPAVLVALYVYSGHESELEITSGVEGQHSPASLHYVGYALDFGIRNLPEGVDPVDVAGEIRDRLTGEYDVVLEATHIHVEFQPKR